MAKLININLRDPYVLPVPSEGKYYLYGTMGVDTWSQFAVGFDGYTSDDLENWNGPFPVFRPSADFWADRNFWAPEVHVYRRKYYMFASFKAEGVGARKFCCQILRWGRFVRSTKNQSRPRIGNVWMAPCS